MFGEQMMFGFLLVYEMRMEKMKKKGESGYEKKIQKIDGRLISNSHDNH